MENKKFLNILESKYLKIFNNLLSIGAVFFLYLLIEKNNTNLNLLKDPYILLALPVLMLSNIFMAKGWSYLSDGKNERDALYDSWFQSMLGKYIPFKIGIPIMRLGKIKEQLKSYETKKLMKNIFIEQIFIIFLSLLIGSFFFIQNYIVKNIMIITLLFFVLINLLFNKKNRILFYSNIIFAQIIILFSLFIFTYFKYDVFYLDLALGYIFSASLSLFFIGSPAGLGIREYIGYNIISNQFPSSLTLEFILFARVLFLVSDLFSYLIYIGYKKFKKL
tara:strand:- start:11398 stop:12228 length:831 start_codon:yes stop_codon:yes gene_type:complete